MLLLLISQFASAQPRDAARVVAGEDLAAWRQLLEDRAPGHDALTDVSALTAFVREFPSSPLSELAYRQLVALGHDLPVDLRLGRIAESYRDHEAALRRDLTEAVVAPLSMAPSSDVHTSVEPDAGLAWVVEAGAGLAEGPAVYVGAGWRLGPVGLTARGVMERELHLGAAVKVLPWTGTWQPFAELAYLGPRPNGELVGGVLWQLTDGYMVEVAAGVNRDLDGGSTTPASRLGLVVAF